MKYYIYNHLTKTLFTWDSNSKEYLNAGKLTINQRINFGIVNLLKSRKYINLVHNPQI